MKLRVFILLALFSTSSFGETTSIGFSNFRTKDGKTVVTLSGSINGCTFPKDFDAVVDGNERTLKCAPKNPPAEKYSGYIVKLEEAPFYRTFRKWFFGEEGFGFSIGIKKTVSYSNTFDDLSDIPKN